MGTYQAAVCAKISNKPFYVAVESYKFARMYPLTQRDVKSLCVAASQSVAEAGVKMEAMTIDFTPAEYITLLLTDLGVLTPAAVSDELIKLYQ